MTTSTTVVSERTDRCAIIRIDRPEVRNALDGNTIERLRTSIAAADADPAVDAVILTGADPAFCAGLDLTALSAGDPILAGIVGGPSHRPWPATSKPVIGAVNGATRTGGLELALNCDFLIASERATFADTHTRFGVLPAWRLSVELPAAIGRRMAMWMSTTGQIVDAQTAQRAGLVVEVVEHRALLDEACKWAAAVSAQDQLTVQALLALYRQAGTAVAACGIDLESAASQAWTTRLPDRLAVSEHHVQQQNSAELPTGNQEEADGRHHSDA
ncbi:enoyl-CoA hydratase [Gordonia sp. TBRC 11910]|uniref:Enoyl-CoA hydratase n=1 Tax=Gordonia asplenii TaxID=2725283 RepID=A0A848L843_9ACTN|nr:enoyl-CoA hydratase [Gordonia asplenii]NMO05145.1 enoyl-CoA hydratase [Gordonia asplenii]